MKFLQWRRNIFFILKKKHHEIFLLYIIALCMQTRDEGTGGVHQNDSTKNEY